MSKVFLINPSTNLFVESVNATLIKHEITEWRAPETCIDCAANPEMAKFVHIAEAANAKALEAMLPFFKGNPDPTILLDLFMSGYTAQQEYLKEHFRE